MASSSKRQTTMAKMAREQSVRERRARKEQKRADKKQAAAAAAQGITAESALTPAVDADETPAETDASPA